MNPIEQSILDKATFKEQKYISGRFKIKELIEFFSALATEDAKNDKRFYTKYQTIETVALVFSVLSFIITIILILTNLPEENEEMTLSPSIYITGISIFILSQIIYWYFRMKINNYIEKEDVHNVIHSYCMPLFYFLKDEIGEQAKLKIQFDNSLIFDDYADSTTNDFIQKTSRIQIDSKKYNGMPISLQMNFADGIYVALRLKTIFQIDKIHITKYNRRGKNKSKTKYKTKAKFKHTTIIGIPKASYIQNKKFNPFSSDGKYFYFKFNTELAYPKATEEGKTEIIRKWLSNSSYVCIDEIIRAIHELYLYVRK